MRRAFHSIFHFALDKIATVADCIQRVYGDIVSYIRLRAHHHQEVPHLVNAYNAQVCVSNLSVAQLAFGAGDSANGIYTRVNVVSKPGNSFWH